MPLIQILLHLILVEDQHRMRVGIQLSLESMKKLRICLMLFPILVVVIVASRLVHRKGIDLLIGILPQILANYPNIRFRIGSKKKFSNNK